MTVYLLIREDQNEHGYVDTTIAGVFRDARSARQQELVQRLKARAEGLTIEDDDSPDGEWQVSWAIEKHLLS
jgi:hypothetical protein